jgi:hypothetical protein
MTTTIALVAGGLAAAALGAVLSPLLTGRNERRAQRVRLHVAALNDALDAFALAGNSGNSPAAKAQYASAFARIAVHGSPALTAACQRFQANADTGTPAGCEALAAVVKAARAELGYERIDDDAISTLLFGEPGRRLRARR